MNGDEILNFLQTAASEMGYEEQKSIEEGYADSEAKIRFKKFCGNGGNPKYYGECRADSIYDDNNFIQNMLGDRIYGEPNREEILNDLESEFPKAVKNLRRT